jgi:hypothetical protein
MERKLLTDLNLQNNKLVQAGFEVVTALPTTNLFVGRKVVMDGIEYTYNGVKFIANGINTIDKEMRNRNLTTLTPDEISYNDIIYNTPYIYASSFNSTLESFTPEVVETYTDNSWQTISFPNQLTSSNTPIRFTMFKNRNSVSGGHLGMMSSIFMWTRDLGSNVHIKIEYQSYNTDTQTFDWFIVKELDFIEKTCIIPLPLKTLYPSNASGNNKGIYYIDNARITISFLNSNSQIALRGLKFNTTGIIPLTDVKFDINYDAVIKPTQTGNTVTKTNNWALQYLTQGVHWLRDNTQPIISDLATIRSNASNGNTAYGWGNHANAGYAKQSEVTEEINHAYNTLFDKIPTELPPIDNSVTTAKIVDASISTNKIQDKAIIGSKIGQEEITTNHIANSAITLAKLEKSSVVINGISIKLGDWGRVQGLVGVDGYECFLAVENNELILSKVEFGQYGSIANIEELVRYPLYTTLPTIPIPTTNAIEITNVNNWFNPNVDKYIIPDGLMRELLTGNVPMAELLNTLNGASCTLTAYNVDCNTWRVDMSTLLTHLINKENYEVYVENDIDDIIHLGLCSLVFKVDGDKIIIECYRKITV